ncbi:hypothetical protein AHF37_04844 [Paragonimus kellicotti]|nr:hypothetical protein AHF37_04844 [Paragonimus kellicotti]
MSIHKMTFPPFSLILPSFIAFQASPQSSI